MLLDRFAMVLATAALVSGLALPTGLPEVANIAYLVIAGIGLLVFSWAADWRAIFGQPAVMLPLVAVTILLVAFALTARSPMHVLAIYFFAPLIVVAGQVAIYARAARLVTPASIAVLAALGCLAALGVALFEIFVLGRSRGGDLVNNPIHFADLSLTLAFISLVGIYAEQTWVKVVGVCGLLLGLSAMILADARGPLVATPPMALIAVAILAFQFRDRLKMGWVIGCAAAGVAGLTLVAVSFGMERAVGAFADALAVAQNWEAVDGSIGQRLDMYESAFNAFMASPVYGHGLFDFVATAARYAPEGMVMPQYEHLHSDIADFAVIGGMIGLIAYVIFLAAPLAGALAIRQGSMRRAAIYLGAIVGSGYFAMGITNAMFGILSQTVLFAVVLCLIAALGARTSDEPDR